MNPKTLIFEDVKEQSQELFNYIKKQSMIYDISTRELYKFLIVLSRKEVKKYDIRQCKKTT